MRLLARVRALTRRREERLNETTERRPEDDPARGPDDPRGPEGEPGQPGRAPDAPEPERDDDESEGESSDDDE